MPAAPARAEQSGTRDAWRLEQRIPIMMTKETALMFARYSDWADQVLFKAMDGLPAGAVYKTGTTLFGSMVNTLNHNYQVDLIWRAHLLGAEHGFTSRRDVLHADFAELVKEQSHINQWYIDWAQAQDAESLAKQLKFKFVSGSPGEMTRGGMFLHVVNHKTYHRGWVAQMFFDFGMKPPQTDLSVFLCEV